MRKIFEACVPNRGNNGMAKNTHTSQHQAPFIVSARVGPMCKAKKKIKEIKGPSLHQTVNAVYCQYKEEEGGTEICDDLISMMQIPLC